MRRAERTNARRSFEFGHAGCGALRFVLKIIGADCSTSSAVVSELLLLLEGAAVEMVDIVIPNGRSSERERCCGGGGVPRRPASGQAGPLACAELSRGTRDGWAAARHAGSLTGSQGRDRMLAQAVCACSMHVCTRIRL